MWYFTEELVIFALFDKNLSDERKIVAKKVLTSPRPRDIRAGEYSFCSKHVWIWNRNLKRSLFISKTDTYDLHFRFLRAIHMQIFSLPPQCPQLVSLPFQMPETIQWNFEVSCDEYQFINIGAAARKSDRLKFMNYFKFVQRKSTNVYFCKKSWNQFLMKKLRLHNMNYLAKQWPNTLIFAPNASSWFSASDSLSLSLSLSLFKGIKISFLSERDHGSCSKHCKPKATGWAST